MPLPDALMSELADIRHRLHQTPELSGQESGTAASVRDFLQRYNPDRIISGIGGNGVAAVFGSGQAGPSVLVRCELDGLPIEETGNPEYKSRSPGKGHQCGHDGHMAIVIGVAAQLSENKLPRGRVALLFQPAEETGKGALAVIADPKFEEIKSDFILSLHNLPGRKIHSILLKAGHINCASRGVRIRLTGKTAHASMPEAGISPAMAIAETIGELNTHSKPRELDEHFALVTIVHAELGEKAFGVSPAHGEVWATLRTVSDSRMKDLVASVEAIAGRVAKTHGLALEIEYDDIFNACENNAAVIGHLRASAEACGYAIEDLSEPLRFSEDFGEFARTGASAMFFLGAGKDVPDLHNPDYDFPDALLDTGVTLLHTTICRLLGQNVD